MELLIELNELARHAISTQVGGQIISNGREIPLFEVLQGQEAKTKRILPATSFSLCTIKSWSTRSRAQG